MALLIPALVVLALLALVTHGCRQYGTAWPAFLRNLFNPAAYPGSLTGETLKYFNFDIDDETRFEDVCGVEDAASDSTETGLEAPQPAETTRTTTAASWDVRGDLMRSLAWTGRLRDNVRGGLTRGLDRAVDRMVQSIETMAGVDQAATQHHTRDELEIVA